MFQMGSEKCKAKTNLFTCWFIIIGGTVRSWLIKQWLFSHVGLELLSDLIFFFLSFFCFVLFMGVFFCCCRLSLGMGKSDGRGNCPYKSAQFLLRENQILTCSTGRKKSCCAALSYICLKKEFCEAKQGWNDCFLMYVGQDKLICAWYLFWLCFRRHLLWCHL